MLGARCSYAQYIQAQYIQIHIPHAGSMTCVDLVQRHVEKNKGLPYNWGGHWGVRDENISKRYEKYLNKLPAGHVSHACAHMCIMYMYIVRVRWEFCHENIPQKDMNYLNAL
jgi:hypothetical protein